MSEIVLNEENLKKLIDVLSKSELTESEKTDFAKDINQIVEVYAEIQKRQEVTTHLLIKAKEELKRAQKGKSKKDPISCKEILKR